jgi:hypothetical protein
MNNKRKKKKTLHKKMAGGLAQAIRAPGKQA